MDDVDVCSALANTSACRHTTAVPNANPPDLDSFPEPECHRPPADRRDIADLETQALAATKHARLPSDAELDAIVRELERAWAAQRAR